MTFSVSAPTNNTGALLNNGTEVLSVSSNNYIGIGTNSPIYDFHVKGTDGDTRIRLEDTTGYTSLDMVCANGSLNVINFGDASDINVGRIDYDHSLNEFTFKTNDVEQMRIDSNGYVTKPSQVSFFARGVATTAWSSYTADGDPLIFDAVISNQGNAYNSSTGTFTAPVTGTYIFNVHLRFDNLRDTTHDYYHPFWKVNGSANWNGAILRLITSAPTTKQYMSLHESINLYLAENDTVQFAHGDSNSITNANTTAFNGSQCRFSGYLLG